MTIPRHETDIDRTDRKQVSRDYILLAGNCRLVPAVVPTADGYARYTVTDPTEGDRLLGYVEARVIQRGVSVVEVSAALDDLLEPRTVRA